MTTLHRRALLLAAEAAGETPTSALQGFGLFYMEWCDGLAMGLRLVAIAVLDTVALPFSVAVLC